MVRKEVIAFILWDSTVRCNEKMYWSSLNFASYALNYQITLGNDVILTI